ncbi:DEAD/DEAH box helicase [Candidatus Azambacteria bacterium]|nr:DEAD/DEAH box helicase [Candidatus Azambacteria bacterium]
MITGQQHPEQNIANGFYGLGIAPAILEILEKLRFKTPTPIQAQAIPSAIQGKDVVGIAQTGTGKTLAFGIPMIQHLSRGKGQGLVVLPTRELALQVEEALRKVGGTLGLRTAVLIGGTSLWPQKQALARRPHVIVATPGRLIDHMEQRNVRLDGVSILVLDEADRMLDMGFMPQIQRILNALPRERQTMLFSATMPSEIMKMAATHMKLPTRVEIAPTGTTAERVTQELFIVSRDQKATLLAKLLETYQGPTLVFTRTKHGARKVTQYIRGLNIRVAEIHSNRSLSQRREALDGFKFGKYRVLVATDIASRGIDVKGIELVLNYDLPSSSDDYVHRIGRTARAGAEGHAITFAMPDEGSEVHAIERLIRKSLPVAKHPDLPHVSLSEFSRPAPRAHRGSTRGGGWRFQPRAHRPFGR